MIAADLRFFRETFPATAAAGRGLHPGRIQGRARRAVEMSKHLDLVAASTGTGGEGNSSARGSMSRRMPFAPRGIDAEGMRTVIIIRAQEDRLGIRLKPHLRDDKFLVLDAVTPGLLAYKAGLKAGDLIATINGEAYTNPVAAVKVLRASFGRIEITLSLKAAASAEKNGTGDGDEMFV